MVNKRLLIYVPCVVCPGNIKVIPFLARSDQGSPPGWPPFFTMFVMPKYPGLKSRKKRLEAGLYFVSLSPYVFFCPLCVCFFLKLTAGRYNIKCGSEAYGFVMFSNRRKTRYRICCRFVWNY